ncbi:MAG: hypothetical protein Q4G33_10155, partial [bacterium]|nr:hypothetical protein [bacterium]
NLDENSNEPLINKIQNFLQDEFDDKVGELTIGDLQVAANLDVSDGTLLSWDELIERIQQAKKEITDDTTAQTLNDKFTALNNSGMAESFQKLKTAMDELSDEGSLQYSTVADISDTFKNAVPNIEKYISALLNSDTTADEAAKAISALTQEYITNKVVSGQLTDADENMVAAMLDESGIANSAAIAHEMVARTKFLEALQSEDLASMSTEEVQALQAEAEACGITADEFSSLAELQALAQQSMTSVSMTETLSRLGIMQSEIEGIKSLADAYTLLASKGRITKGSYGSNSVAQYDEAGKLVAFKDDNLDDDSKQFLSAAQNIAKYNEQIENLKSRISGVSYKGTTPQFKPSDSKDKEKDKEKDTADNIKNINEQLEDLSESEALDKLKNKFDNLEQSIEKIDNTLSLLSSTLDMQAEDDYVGKLETTTRQLDLASQKSELLRNEFNQLAAVKPINAEMANEVASRAKSITDSIAENKKNIIQYAKDITDYYTSALKSISTLGQSSLERASSLFDRNVETLKKGGLTGLQFTLSPTVPQSAVDKQRAESREYEDYMQAHYDTLAQMQKTALDMQYQETLADNERKRQELIESLNEAQEEYSKYSSGVQTTQLQTNTATSQAQKQDHAEKAAETQSFSNIVEGIIVDTNNWMINNPIQAPGLDTASWEDMV